MENFIKNIHEESQFLQSTVTGSLPTPNIQCVADYKRYIYQLRMALVNNGIRVARKLSETSSGNHHEYDLFKQKIKFGYQRYDLELKENDWLNYLYNYKCNQPSFGFFTSSGMGSICSVLFALQNIAPHIKQFKFTSLPYFETYFFIRDFFKNILFSYLHDNQINEKYVVWIDTSSPFYHYDFPGQNHPELIVIDTSCLSSNDSSLSKIIDNSIKRHIPLILVKSHIKLDNFSTEYARLGSIVIVPNHSDLVSEKLFSCLKHAIGFSGTNFFIQNVYPWFGMPLFFNLNQKKQQRVMFFCQTMLQEIKPYFNKLNAVLPLC